MITKRDQIRALALLADLVAAERSSANTCLWCGIPITEMTRDQMLALIARLVRPLCIYEDHMPDPFQ